MAVAGLLGASEGQVRFCADGWGVDVDDAGVKIARGLKSLIDVARVNLCGQSVGNAVGNFNSLLEAVDRNHRDHGAKDFFLGDAHLRRAIAKHGGRVEPTLRVNATVQAISPGEELRSFVFADLDVTH